MSFLLKSLLFNNINIKQYKLYHTTIINYGNFTARDFIYDNFRGTSGTLINRFIKYIAIENVKYKNVIRDEIKYVQYYPLNDMGDYKNMLRGTNTNQLPKLLSFTYTYRSNADINKFVEIVNELDDECSHRIDIMTNEEILKLLYGYIFLLPNRISQTDFYNRAIQKLVQNFNDKSPKFEFIEICFYLGIWKKNMLSTKMMQKFLNDYLDAYLLKLNQMEFMIVANAAYKTSASLSENSNFKSRLADEIISLKINEEVIPNLVTLLKSARQNRIRLDAVNEKIVTFLEDYSESGEDFIDFRGLTHLFTYLADNLYVNNLKCYDILLKLSFDQIHRDFNFYDVNSPDNLNYRPKDIASFIWSFSFLGLDKNSSGHFNTNNINLLKNIIQFYVKNDAYKYNPDCLVDTILSLWMVDIKLHEYLPKIKQLKINNAGSSNRVKLDSRIHLLYALEGIERNRIDLNDNDEAPEYLIKNRPKLLSIYNHLKSDEYKYRNLIKNIRFVTAIRNLNIAGLLIRLENKNDTKNPLQIYLECYDETNTCSDKITPIGIFKLKLRTLKQIECNLIEVPAETCSPAELTEYLEEEMFKFIEMDYNIAEELN